MNETELLAHYRPWVRSVAHSLVPAHRVEEFAQEGWIAMWRAWCSFDSEGAPLDFRLKDAAYKRMISLRRSLYAVKNTQHELTDQVPETGDVAAALEMAYHRGEIGRALDVLSPREREYVLLRFWGDVHGREMIDHFGYQPHALWVTARAKLAVALAHLRTCVP